MTIKLVCYKGENMKMGVVWMRLSFKLFSEVLIVRSHYVTRRAMAYSHMSRAVFGRLRE